MSKTATLKYRLQLDMESKIFHASNDDFAKYIEMILGEKEAEEYKAVAESEGHSFNRERYIKIGNDWVSHREIINDL